MISLFKPTKTKFLESFAEIYEVKNWKQTDEGKLVNSIANKQAEPHPLQFKSCN